MSNEGEQLVTRMRDAIYPEIYGPGGQRIKLSKEQTDKHLLRAKRAIEQALKEMGIETEQDAKDVQEGVKTLNKLVA